LETIVSQLTIKVNKIENCQEVLHKQLQSLMQVKADFEMRVDKSEQDIGELQETTRRNTKYIGKCFRKPF